MGDSIRQFTQRLKFVKPADFLAVIPMTLGFICSLFVRIVHNNIWLICEREDEARDNGYHFFKYMCNTHPEIEVVYAIKKTCNDYSKVKALGKVIPFGSLLHWIYYFAAKRNVSSQKEGKPNPALCYILEVYFNCRRNRAYIRHGISKDDQRWVYYDVTKMNLFVCAAGREYEFVKAKFGYPSENVKLLGLCRYDNLLKVHSVKRQILVMPTMREWLRTVSQDTNKYEKTKEVGQSEYFKRWNDFLSNRILNNLLLDNSIKLIFYPHSSMQKYIDLFCSISDSVIIADADNYDVQELLMESSILITDYSSVFFDFAYMEKPIIYYQFDYEKFRLAQYQEGYFSYIEDGFGKVVDSEEDLICEISNILRNDLKMETMYKKRVEDFFAFHDGQNCQRTYEAILEMG